MVEKKIITNNAAYFIFQDEVFNPREEYNIGTMVCKHRRYNLGDEQAENIENYSSWEEWFENEIGIENMVYLPLYLFNHSGLSINTTGFNCKWDSEQVGWIYAPKTKFINETAYSEEELFSADKYRLPKQGEHVIIKGYEDNGWGKVIQQENNKIVVDFDYNKAKNFRSPKNIIECSLSDVAEVMANQAKRILENEVKTYDHYLNGDVYCLKIHTLDPEKTQTYTELINKKLDELEEYDFSNIAVDEEIICGFFGSDFKNNGLFDYIPSEYHF